MGSEWAMRWGVRAAASGQVVLPSGGAQLAGGLRPRAVCMNSEATTRSGQCVFRMEAE